MKERVKFDKLLHGGDYNPEQWLDHPDILEKDIEYFKKAHINVVSVGIFSWAVLEPEEGKYNFDWLEKIINNLYENGISVFLATPTGARPKWMADKYSEVLRVEADRRRNLFGARHNHCYTSPVYREKTRQMNRKLSEKFGNHPGVLLWHISNELGGECHCPLCQAAFREWLREQYGTIENLNQKWCTTFWSHQYRSFDEIESPSPHGEMALHALNLDWRRFVTKQTLEFLDIEKAAIIEGGSQRPVTVNLMYDYKGLDYSKFKDAVDIISWDNYPTWHKEEEWKTALDCAMQHDLMRSIKKKPFLLMESCPSATNWQSVSKLKRPGMLMAASLQAIAHGSDSVMYFQMRQSRGASEKFHGAVIDHYGGDDTRVFKEVTQVGETLENLAEIAGTTTNAKVAILYDRENYWAMTDAQGPRNCDLKYMECIKKQYNALRHLGLDVDIISMSHELSNYQLVVAPMAYMIKNGYEEEISKYVQNGGTLVMTYWSAVVDEYDRCYLGGTPHGLMDVFGIRAMELDALYDWDENAIEGERTYRCQNYCELIELKGASPLYTYTDDFYNGMPAVTRNLCGEGKAYYIATDVEESFYLDFYKELTEEAGIPRIFELLPDGVEVTTRENDEAIYVFLQNFSRKSVQIIVPEEYKYIYGIVNETLIPLETKVLKRQK